MCIWAKRLQDKIVDDSEHHDSKNTYFAGTTTKNIFFSLLVNRFDTGNFDNKIS
jgi:hypothetical protein